MKRFALVALALTILTYGRAAAAENLTRIYAGEDGSALYTRSDGTDFVAFAEHPGKNYALVLRGVIKGNDIDIDWWDVPKDGHQRKGEAILKWSQNGTRIVRTGGDTFGSDVFREINASQVPWPNMAAAGFQGEGSGDLTGVFEGQDHSRWYIRETPYNVVGVAEAAAQPGERPRWVAVFFGKRKGSGSISGEWFDVAKGLDRKKGGFGAALMTPADSIWGRELMVELTGTERGKRIEPDYALDYTKMAKTIEAHMKDSGAVGWSYAIAGNGTVLRKGAGGSRQLKQDGGQRDFTPNTLAQAASVSKLVTAVTLAKVLKDNGYDFNDKVAQFLPQCWKRGPGVATLTFGDIASQHTGFSDGATDKAVPDDNRSKRVRKTFEMGQVVTLKPGAFSYQNANYETLRYLVALVGKRDKALGIFKKFDCKDIALLNEQIAVLFNELTFDMLRMADVTPGKDASFLPQGKDDFSLNYDWQDRKKAGSAPNPQGPYRGGAGYLALSAVGAGKFLAAFDGGEILPMTWVRTMKNARYGFDSWYNSKAGRAMWKNGGCPGKSCSAWAIIFPGHVEAYLVTNSSFQIEDFDRNPDNGLNLGEVLLDAYQQGFK
ncbi:MAG TPA: serine hydrolase domain-containing protein [Dongiaceae bacterium]|nr:serine hydrolase domain-containing protein [Dongiaceae bacterium]